MPEYAPSLSEIENVNADPERGSGEPAVVYDDRALLSQLNQNAQLNQANQWRRYTRFLDDLQANYANQQDIADKPVADSDREYLKNKSVKIFSSALKNPDEIYNPEFQQKVAGLRSDAVSSKLARDYAEKNALYLVTNPEFNTDENKEIIDDYLHNQTIENGGRKMFTLNVPDIFDTVSYFSALRSDPRVKEMINANRVDEEQGLTYERQDAKYKYKPFLELVKLGYDSTPKIQKKAKADFEALPPEIKRNFENAKDYWVNFGSKHFGSPNFDDVIEQGKEVIQAYDAPFKKQQIALSYAELAEKKRAAMAADATDRYIAGLRKYGDGKSATIPEMPITPLPAIFGTIGGENKTIKIKDLPISQVAAINPNWIKKDDKGKLTDEILEDFENLEVAVGKKSDGAYGVFYYPNKGEYSNRQFVNEQALKSNAENWMATYAKERKGQDVYATLKPLFEQFKLRDKGNVGIQTEIPTLTTKEQFDALPSGAFYYRDGKKYQKP